MRIIGRYGWAIESHTSFPSTWGDFPSASSPVTITGRTSTWLEAKGKTLTPTRDELTNLISLHRQREHQAAWELVEEIIARDEVEKALNRLYPPSPLILPGVQ